MTNNIKIEISEDDRLALRKADYGDMCLDIFGHGTDQVVTIHSTPKMLQVIATAINAALPDMSDIAA